MPRARNPKVDKAERLYQKGFKLKDIASKLGLPEGTVRRWKSTYKWDSERSEKKANVRNKGGAPKNNKNAAGNSGGSAPLKNNNAEKFGFFRKYLPEETVSIIEEMPEDPLDVLWDQIQIAYAAIIRAQQIMYVKDKEDKTKEVTLDGEASTAYDVQQAWDKQAGFLKSQARAQAELRSSIRQYEELLHKNWELATEEQKARIEQVKAKTKTLSGGNEADEALDRLDKILERLKGNAADG